MPRKVRRVAPREVRFNVVAGAGALVEHPFESSALKEAAQQPHCDQPGEQTAECADNDAAEGQRQDHLSAGVQDHIKLFGNLPQLHLRKVLADIDKQSRDLLYRRAADQLPADPVVEGEDRGDGHRIGYPDRADRRRPVEVGKGGDDDDNDKLNSDGRSKGDKGSEGKPAGNGPRAAAQTEKPAQQRPQFEQQIAAAERFCGWFLLLVAHAAAPG